MNLLLRAAGGIGAVLLAMGAVATYKSTETFQMGFPGVGMELVEAKASLIDKSAKNKVPPALPPANAEGKLAVDAYKNVQVLGHLTSGDFTRLMTAMTLWVSPKQGCAYCHAHEKDAAGNVIKNAEGYPQADLNNMHSDELYAKRVARRMLQMTMHVNADWQAHVQATGVTCYTCHRGNPVPAHIWYDEPVSPTAHGMVGNRAEQNAPSYETGLSSLPSTAFRAYLAGDENIRIQSEEAIDSKNRASIKQTEWSYSLMMHMSTALGVNCTYCHNTRAMGEWSLSPATRATAWYGIRMVRDLNKDYLEPLLGTLPPERLGKTGDVPKANCATCHQGAYKPLLGVSMLKDYAALARPMPQPEKTPEPPPQSEGMDGIDGGAPEGGASNDARTGATPSGGN